VNKDLFYHEIITSDLFMSELISTKIFRDEHMTCITIEIRLVTRPMDRSMPTNKIADDILVENIHIDISMN
jgi:hypothetical protein